MCIGVNVQAYYLKITLMRNLLSAWMFSPSLPSGFGLYHTTCIIHICPFNKSTVEKFLSHRFGLKIKWIYIRNIHRLSISVRSEFNKKKSPLNRVELECIDDTTFSTLYKMKFQMIFISQHCFIEYNRLRAWEFFCTLFESMSVAMAPLDR